MMRGDAARTYQEQMRRRGGKVDVNGWFDAESVKITRVFQAEKGLEADGVVGPNTWDCAFRCPLA